ncbi:MAG: hypothetical protein J7J52_03925, partial [Deltaproteobacteria bacterium]|nr:hypothetical protein [Deltaproteobacteria bacterium]
PRKKKKGNNLPPDPGASGNLIAKFGGYLGRSNDPPPGHQLMWKGYAHLQLMCNGFELSEYG